MTAQTNTRVDESEFPETLSQPPNQGASAEDSRQQRLTLQSDAAGDKSAIPPVPTLPEERWKHSEERGRLLRRDTGCLVASA